MIEATPEHLIGDKALPTVFPLDAELKVEGVELIAPHHNKNNLIRRSISHFDG